MTGVSRRSFLKWTSAAGVPLALGSLMSEQVLGAASRRRSGVPDGVELDSLRREIEDGPGVLVARAVALGWSVVRDETVLKRSAAWQHELAVAVARHRVELAAIEAVVDLGRVTFASASPIVRRGVIVRLDAAIRQARRLRCRHLLVVPGLMPEGVAGGEVWRRVDELLSECRVRAGLAGMRIVVERIERRSDQASLVQEEG